MRTPLELARALGWPEGWQRENAALTARDAISNSRCRAPGPRWTPGSRCTRKAGHKGVHRADSHTYWSPDDRPRLVITSNRPDDGWWYQTVNREGYGNGSYAPTQPAALALGLAALDTATHRVVHSGGRA